MVRRDLSLFGYDIHTKVQILSILFFFVLVFLMDGGFCQLVDQTSLRNTKCTSDADCHEYPNSQCKVYNSNCICNVGYGIVDHRNSSSTCEKLAIELKEPCTYSEQCQLSFGTESICKARICDCRNGSVFNEINKYCYKDKATQFNCTSSADCDDQECFKFCKCKNNEILRKINGRIRCFPVDAANCEIDEQCQYGKMEIHSNCKNGQCLCNENAEQIIESKSNLCVKKKEAGKFGSPCRTNQHCNIHQNMECRENACLCKPSYQNCTSITEHSETFCSEICINEDEKPSDNETGKDLPIFFITIGSTGLIFLVTAAVFVLYKAYKGCKCRKKTYNTRLNETCKRNSNCLHNTCMDSYCVCPSNKIFYNDDCLEKRNLFDSCNFDIQCNNTVKHSHCTEECRCNSNFIPKNGICYKVAEKYGSSCEIHEQCNELRENMECRKQTCSCKPDYYPCTSITNVSAITLCLDKCECEGGQIFDTETGKCYDNITSNWLLIMIIILAVLAIVIVVALLKFSEIKKFIQIHFRNARS